MANISGNAWVYKDNVDTDVIIPARYLNTSDPNELAKYCMEDIDKDFASNVKEGDIIIAGENFGCGSSREHAPIAIKASGISVVIAKTFARIFFRNAINIGLPILENSVLPDEENACYVIVTRGHKDDRLCLEKTIRKPHLYLGMIVAQNIALTLCYVCW